MKLLLIVLISLLILLAALTGASYQLPTQLEVQQSIVLNAAPEEVFTLLDNPTEWQKWSVLNKQADPSIIHLYGGPMYGPGARMQWSGDRAGNGQVVFTESISPQQLTYLQSEESDTNKLEGTFTLQPVEGGTQVVWRQQAPVGEYPWQRVKGVLQQYKKQEEAAQGLLGLKTLLQHSSKKKGSKSTTAYVNQH